MKNLFNLLLKEYSFELQEKEKQKIIKKVEIIFGKEVKLEEIYRNGF